MGRVTKRGATSSWDANHAALYQKGFRDLGWDPLEIKGPAIKEIIEGAIANDGDFESLRWLFSKKQGGEKDSNSNLYYHYKEEASEYITQLARIGIRSRCCLSSSRHVSFYFLFVIISPCCPLSLYLSLLLPTEKFLENGSVEGGRQASAGGGVAAAAGAYRDNNNSEDDDSDIDSDGEDLDDSSAEEEEEVMPTKAKGATPQKKAAGGLALAIPTPKGANKKNTLEVDCPAMKELEKRFAKAKLREDRHVAFDFSVMFPYFWFLYCFNGCNYIQLEMTIGSTHPEDLSLSISDDGKYVIVKNLVMDAILLHQRLYQRRFQIPDQALGDHLLNQAGTAAQQYVREQIGEEGAWSVVIIPLPFACQQHFTDPYTAAGEEDTGKALTYLKHPRYVAPEPPDINNPVSVQAYLDAMDRNPMRRVCLMSLTLKSAVLPKSLRGATIPETIIHDL